MSFNNSRVFECKSGNDTILIFTFQNELKKKGWYMLMDTSRELKPIIFFLIDTTHNQDYIDH